MKIGITGSEGYLGSTFVKMGCIPLVGDITKKDEIESVIASANVDAVIHCAAMTDVDECEKDFNAAFQANVIGTENVLAALVPTQRFYYLSTDHVFPGRNIPFGFRGYSENHEPSPINKYGWTKYGGEIVTRTSTHINTVIIRLSKVFSKYTLMENFNKLHSGFEVVFSKLIWRSFIHRDHIASTILDLTTKSDTFRSCEIINVAGDEIISCYQFWLLMADIYDLDPKLVIPREIPLMDATHRPFVAGLNIGKLKSYGLNTYHPVDGIVYMKQNES